VIALRDSLPVLRLDDGTIELIRREWLCGCLARASVKAGYIQWWLAEHVTESILCFLAGCYAKPAITIPELNEFIRSALQAIGHGEVALKYETLEPPCVISLAELAAEAGPGYELAFFQLLKERMRPILSRRSTNIHVLGLQNCVRFLQSVKTWSRSCSELRTEIVDFLRAQLEKDKPEVLLTIR
jgi:hypothetical protein